MEQEISVGENLASVIMNGGENEANECRNRERESRPGGYAAWEAALFALGSSPGYDNRAAQVLNFL